MANSKNFGRHGAFLLFFYLVVLASCSLPTSPFTDPNSFIDLPSTSPDDPTLFKVSIGDSLNGQSYQIGEKEVLLAGTKYTFAVTDTSASNSPSAMGHTESAAQTLEWNLTVVPTGACAWENGTDLNKRTLSCTGDAKFEIEILVLSNGVVKKALVSRTVKSVTSMVAPGKILYQQNCASCHGDVATSLLKGKTGDQIANALRTNSFMQLPKLQSLTAVQIRSITSALADSSNTTPTMPTYDGVQLYGQNCALCHNSLSSSTKAGKTSQEIKLALQQVSFMQTSNLQALSDAEVTAIATALGSVTTPSPTPTPSSTDGPTLYSNNCASCHGTLNISSKIGRSSTLISNAIQSVSTMNSLSNLRQLTSTEIAAIATALNIATPTPSPTPTPVDPGTTPDLQGNAETGTTLYAQKCMACHNNLSDSSKKGKDSATIKAALTSISTMQSASALQGLTDQEIADIAAALGIASPVTPLTPGFRQLSATFLLFQSTSTTATDDNLVRSYVNTYITNKSEYVGGIYDIYALGSNVCNKSGYCVENKLNGYANPPASSIRRGYINRFCEEVLSRNVPMTNFLAVKQLTGNSTMTDENITSVFQVFLPGRTPPTPVLTKLKDVGTNAKTLTNSNTEGWRYILYTLCISSAVDLL